MSVLKSDRAEDGGAGSGQLAEGNSSRVWMIFSLFQPHTAWVFCIVKIIDCWEKKWLSKPIIVLANKWELSLHYKKYVCTITHAEKIHFSPHTSLVSSDSGRHLADLWAVCSLCRLPFLSQILKVCVVATDWLNLKCCTHKFNRHSVCLFQIIITALQLKKHASV